MIYKYIKFTGDYAKLKSMGYKFQRLFAGNYMQWCKDDEYRVWKKGAELTISLFTNHEGSLLELLLTCRDNKTPIPLKMGKARISVNIETYEISLDSEKIMAIQMEAMNALEACPWQTVYTKPEMIEYLYELYDMGWIEVATLETLDKS